MLSKEKKNREKKDYDLQFCVAEDKNIENERNTE